MLFFGVRFFFLYFIKLSAGKGFCVHYCCSRFIKPARVIHRLKACMNFINTKSGCEKVSYRIFQPGSKFVKCLYETFVFENNLP